MANESEIKYLTPIAVETQRKKYCRFKKLGIKYIDYKDADFLLKFVNEQGKILPLSFVLPRPSITLARMG